MKPLRRIASAAATIVLALTLFGCRTTRPASLGMIPAEGFVQGWHADLKMRGGEQINRMYLREGVLFVYTTNNRVFAVTPTGGELKAIMQVAPRQGVVRPPVVLSDKWIFPTLSTFEVYTTAGKLERSADLGHATRGPATGSGNYLYVGLDYPAGERLVKVDFTKAFGKTIWELLTFGGISAAPAVMEDAIYAGTEDARVFAVSPDRPPIWTTEGGIFRTEGPIVADLKSDETGVYVACTDSKLYCIDRASGRLKWQYFAGTPLRTQPVVTADAVYQFVPGKGLVAIDKTTGKDFREPRWVAPAAGRFLSQDDKNVYVRSAEGNVAALDRKTGEPRFKSRRNDITVFAWPNTKDAMIYGATPRGEVIAIKPVTTSGTMGQVVMNEMR